MRSGEKDPHTDRLHTSIVERGQRDRRRLDHQIVANGGHCSFLTPYPEAMKSRTIPPSQAPEGFDRSEYLPRLYAEIVAFIRGAVSR